MTHPVEQQPSQWSHPQRSTTVPQPATSSITRYVRYSNMQYNPYNNPPFNNNNNPPSAPAR